jgi:hypothetical protein
MGMVTVLAERTLSRNAVSLLSSMRTRDGFGFANAQLAYYARWGAV